MLFGSVNVSSMLIIRSFLHTVLTAACAQFCIAQGCQLFADAVLTPDAYKVSASQQLGTATIPTVF